MKKGSHKVNRRTFLQTGLAGAAVLTLPWGSASSGQGPKPPNIILVMSDDQGWGDVAYNGNPIVLTPHLDAMARDGLRFDRFYAGAPVCSPTRGSCLTGRHPYRYGITWASDNALPAEEITVAEAVKTAGYRTGHFGKWHVGTMTKTVEDGYMGGPDHPELYAPPWENGFDVCFSTEFSVATYNPAVWCNGKYPEEFQYFMERPVEKGETTEDPGCHEWPAAFWSGPGQKVANNIEGSTPRIVMDRVVEFIREQNQAGTPFLAVVWFYTPHSPIAAGHRHRAPYTHLSIKEQHWYGSLTAMDEQIGRLRHTLREERMADNTLMWFCSDNGPSWIHDYNSAGPFRGKKGSLYEGGIRVPAILEWPAAIPEPRVTDAPCCTSDFFPTIQALTGFQVPGQPEPIDGINVLPLIEGRMAKRPEPIAFQSPIKGEESWHMDPNKKQLALIDNTYKVFSGNGGTSYELYNLEQDPYETTNIAGEHPEVVKTMRSRLEEWVESCRRSEAGEDYT